MRSEFLRRISNLSSFVLKQSSSAAKSVASATAATQHYDEFSQAYPDFMMSRVLNRRDALYEELVQADMLERRLVLDIPEFYVGSIVAVTTADPNLGNRQNRFVGICVLREREGLQHRFTLRNVINGLGVEVMYEMYNPTILKIETLKLEKRLDDNLTYLQDAMPEYSTFDFNLEPITHPPGAPVPVNTLKVHMRPPPWSMRWELYDLKGVHDEDIWQMLTPHKKRQFGRQTMFNDSQKYDVIMHHRDECRNYERDLAVQDRMRKFEEERHKTSATKRRILRMASSPIKAT